MSMPASVAVRLGADGVVVVRGGLHEMGMGAPTAQAQIVADQMGVPLESVRVEYGDSDLPPSAGAFGSIQTASVTASVLAACTKLKKLEARDGGLHHRRGGQSYTDVLAAAGRDHVEAMHKTNLPAFVAGTVRDLRRRVR